MLVLNPGVVTHKIPLYPNSRPVKQKLRRVRPELSNKIKEEVMKQIEAGFIEVFTYPKWVANIVSVPKKDRKVRMCVNYQDLNRASPKDDFPLPHNDVLVDITAKNHIYSFMDGYSGLKNAGATYQRAMVTLFHDMMHKEIEVYEDDMVAKSKEGESHVCILRKLFERLRKYKLRLNPAECTFEAKSGKLLGFIVSEKGIEVDPDKIRVIIEMPLPKSEREVQSFLRRLNYIARFISNLTHTCEL
ncbi:hypothetical protein L6164_001222 [Bauhinia variegata]|uniref:Uncharacterized protein n=1 Tax=Bauhinia variegata TaxID=167791 RepID=A0ACB9Q905_BAUVA|nr:hypothetical protein L6164_001222 [Bauhinia variegata]